MNNYKRLTMVSALSLLLSSASAPGQTAQGPKNDKQTKSQSSTVKSSRPFRVRLGGFSFGAGYSRFSGYYPYYSYYYYSPFYRPLWYQPYYSPILYGDYYPSIMYHPGWATGFTWRPGMGEIRLQANLKDADVYIDDALAGKIKDLKTLWLEPGAYNLKIQAENHEPFTLRIYVLSGKTLKVDANLAQRKEP